MTVMLVRRRIPFSAAVPLFLCLVSLLSGCNDDSAKAVQRQATKVDVVVAARKEHSRKAYLTGVISARVTGNLAFRTAGRVIERNAEVGQQVSKGELLARLDPTEQQADIVAAQANVDAANAQLNQASTNFARQKELLPKGLTSRKVYDQAQESLLVAQGSLDAANAALSNAKENLTFTELRAASDGVITSRSVEAGQTVQAAQTAYTIAEDGDRDAVFNVPEIVVAANEKPPVIALRLLSDPDVTAVGNIREVAPVLDPKTGSVRVKAEISDTPKAMTLGAAIIGSVTSPSQDVIELPWSALFSQGGRPAVWVVDKDSKVVSLKPVEIAAYEDGSIFVRDGLESGEQVVVAGAQLLSTGQVVEAREGKTP
jgi:RND family efflux transporter MFP subunit